MKKVKIVASVVLAAALSATTFAAACGKDSSFKLSDYAHPLDSAYALEHLRNYEERHVKEAFTAVTAKNYTDMESLGNGLADATVETKGTTPSASPKITHTFYDVKNDRELYTGLKSITAIDVKENYYDSNALFKYFVLATERTGQTDTYRYLSPDGQAIALQGNPAPSDLTWSVINKYRDEDDTTRYFIGIKYTYTTGTGTNAKANSVEKFYCYSVDKDGEIAWESVEEEDTETPVDSDYKAGAQFGIERVNLAEVMSDCEEYPESNYDGIEFTYEGDDENGKYTFYKDDKLISSVTVEGEVFFVGNYLYYYSVEPVSFEATRGYNVVTQGISITGDVYEIKENYTLHRFNFVKGGKVKEVDFDYIVTYAEGPLYNYTDKAFDKLTAIAYKKVNGVVVISENTKEYSLVLDDKLNVVADLTATNLSDLEVYKLKDGRYLAGEYILDDGLNTVAELNSPTVWVEKELIATGVYDEYAHTDKTVFVDFDGKVVIEPSKSTTFYGDAAYSGGKIYSAEYPSGIKPEKLVNANKANGDEVSVVYGVIIKVTTVVRTTMSGTDNVVGEYYTVTVYDLSGKMLNSFSNVKDFEYPEIFGGKIVVEAAVYTSLTTGAYESVYCVIR